MKPPPAPSIRAVVVGGRWSAGLRTAALVAFTAGAPGAATALDLERLELRVEPIVRAGTIAWDQVDGTGGHKFLVAAGMNGLAQLERLGARLHLEGWWVAEGLDDDRGVIANDGHHVRADARWLFRPLPDVAVYPFAGLGHEHWDRGGHATVWEDLDLPYAVAGGGLESARAFLWAGITRPFLPRTDTGLDPSPRFGFSSEAGVRVVGITLGLFYHYAAIEDPDAKAIRTGLFIGYRFGFGGRREPPTAPRDAAASPP